MYIYKHTNTHVYIQRQVATFEDALRDAAAEIDELRERVSVNEREKRVATLDASTSKSVLSGLHAEAQVRRERARAASTRTSLERETPPQRASHMM